MKKILYKEHQNRKLINTWKYILYPSIEIAKLQRNIKAYLIIERFGTNRFQLTLDEY